MARRTRTASSPSSTLKKSSQSSSPSPASSAQTGGSVGRLLSFSILLGDTVHSVSVGSAPSPTESSSPADPTTLLSSRSEAPDPTSPPTSRSSSCSPLSLATQSPSPSPASPANRGSRSRGSSSSPVRSKQTRKARKNDPSFVPRPRNAFILFRSHFCHELALRGDVSDPQEVSRSSGKAWKELPPSEVQMWKDRSLEERALHAAKYPAYRFQPTKDRNCRKKKVPARSHVSSDSDASDGGHLSGSQVAEHVEDVTMGLDDNLGSSSNGADTDSLDLSFLPALPVESTTSVADGFPSDLGCTSFVSMPTGLDDWDSFLGQDNEAAERPLANVPLNCETWLQNAVGPDFDTTLTPTQPESTQSELFGTELENLSAYFRHSDAQLFALDSRFLNEAAESDSIHSDTFASDSSLALSAFSLQSGVQLPDPSTCRTQTSSALADPKGDDFPWSFDDWSSALPPEPIRPEDFLSSLATPVVPVCTTIASRGPSASEDNLDPDVSTLDLGHMYPLFGDQLDGVGGLLSSVATAHFAV